MTRSYVLPSLAGLVLLCAGLQGLPAEAKDNSAARQFVERLLRAAETAKEGERLGAYLAARSAPQQTDPARLAQMWAKAVQLNPSSTNARSHALRAHLANGDLAQAALQAQSLADQGATMPALGWAALATRQAMEGRWAKISALDLGAITHPIDLWVLSILQAGAAMRLDNPDLADRLLARSFGASMLDQLARNARGQLRQAEGLRAGTGPDPQADAAARAFMARQIFALASALPTAATPNARHGLHLGLLTLALGLDPNHVEARILAAQVLETSQAHARALSMLEVSLPALPPADLARLRNERVRILIDMDQPQIALATLPQGLDDPASLAHRADALVLLDRLEDANALYAQAIAHPDAGSADLPDLLLRRAMVHLQRKDPQAAQADLAQVLREKPDQPQAMNLLANIWLDQPGHAQAALAQLERAASLYPDAADIADSLGWARLRAGQVDPAIDALERAAQLAPEEWEIADHLGQAYWAAGRTIEARLEWRRAVGLAPDPADQARIRALMQRTSVPASAPATGSPP